MRFDPIRPLLEPSATSRFAVVLLVVVMATLGCKKKEDPQQHTVPDRVVADQEQGVTEEESTRPLRVAEPTDATPESLLRFVSAEAHTYVSVDFDAYRASWVRARLGTEDSRRAALARTGRQLDLLGNDPRVIPRLGQRVYFSRVHEIIAATRAEDDWVVITNPGLVDDPPGAEPSPLIVEGAVRGQSAMRDGWLIIGSGSLFDYAMAPGDAPSFDPQTAWEDGDAALPHEGILRFFSTDYEGLSLGDLFDIPQVGEHAATRVALNAAADASVALVIEGPENDWLPKMLGAARTLSMSPPEFDPAQIPALLRGWNQYTALLARSAWDRIRLERPADNMVRAAIPPPTCGDPSRNFLLATMFAGMIYRVQSSGMDVSEATPLADSPTDRAPANEDCEVMEGPAPQVPLDALRVSTENRGVIGVLMMMDYGALFRANLTTGFGLLPFSIDPDEVRAAFEGHDLGLEALTANSGTAAVYVESQSAENAPALFFAVPPEMEGLVPDRVASTFQQDERLGNVAASPALRGRYLTSTGGDPVWRSLVASVEPSDALVIMLPQPLFFGLSQQFELEPPFDEWVEQLQGAALIVGEDLSTRIALRTSGDSAELRDGLEALFGDVMEQLFRRPNFANRAHRGGQVFSALAEMVSSEVTFTQADEHTVIIHTGIPGRFAAGGAVTVGVYAAMVGLQLSEHGLPRPNITLDPSRIEYLDDAPTP